MIEHDLAAAFRIADRVSAMDEGRIIAEGPPALLRGDAQLQRIYARGGAAPGGRA
jgi:branched-chain amino acid transport system ATP-binding protein